MTLCKILFPLSLHFVQDCMGKEELKRQTEKLINEFNKDKEE